ncbi:AraC family transcriptional regulator [Phenylobacterium deserti]|uniref:AraC family transcriptional regulator n=1 Tax=Phenylobacterium deserti TaxID=1914756 RepID=UPI00140367DD|nr:helix-turn-helix transcriptional regulator [Phenylobacterium deserti]
MYYPPGLRQTRHEHSRAEISMVLAGSFRESQPASDFAVDAGRLTTRAAGAEHAVTFGVRGALILNLSVGSDEGVPKHIGWRSANLASVRRVLAHDPAEALWRLAKQSEPSGARIGSAPPWVRKARERLQCTPVSVAELAAEFGVHRAHLTRSFVSWFGETPSRYRRRIMAERALCAFLTGGSLAESAQAAEFADQAHMNRAIVELTGLAPGRLRRLLG